jgi:glycosyltransferase involved in cell wall biosynthesis
MKLLFITALNSYLEQTGSGIMACNHMKFLSSGHLISFICYDRSYHSLRQIQNKIKALEKEHKYDAILLYNLETIKCCPPSFYDKAIVILEELSSIKFRLQRELSVYSLWKKTKLFVCEKLAGNYERKMLPRAAKVLMLSQAGAITAQQKGHNNIRHITYGIEHQQNIFDIGHRSDKMIVFTGNMYHPPNVDGAISFLLKIFPFILESCPLAKLWIVGARPDRRIYKAAKSFGDSVVITGQVESVYYYLARAMVSVCPVRLKIGPQTKVLESLSCGTPVVATSASNEGVGGLNGVDLWVEDEPIMFARRVLELLRGVGWQRLSDNGRKLADKFSWEQSAKELEQNIENVRQNRQG